MLDSADGEVCVSTISRVAGKDLRPVKPIVIYGEKQNKTIADNNNIYQFRPIFSANFKKLQVTEN